MSKQIKGVWKFNETILERGWAASADATKEYVNFTAYRSDDEPAYNYIGFNLQHYTYSNGSGTLDNLQFLKTTTTADRVYVWEKRSTDTYKLGWQNETQRIVDFGETEQTVSDEFYYWLMAVANRVAEKTKAVSGVWQFNETIEDAIFSHLYISFWSNGSRWIQFVRVFLNASFTPIGFGYRVKPGDTWQYAYLYDDFNNLTKGWQSDAFRTVDFGAAEQLVCEHEYEWLVANAKYLGESDAHPVYIDIDGYRFRTTAYMDIDGVREKVSTARQFTAKYLYNSVCLPRIPNLQDYPYCWIRKNTTSGYYDLLFSNIPFYKDTTVIKDGSGVSGKPWYRVDIATAETATEWINNTASNTYNGWTIDDSRPVIWSNHDIPNGSATATDIYFKGTEPRAVVATG